MSGDQLDATDRNGRRWIVDRWGRYTCWDNPNLRLTRADLAERYGPLHDTVDGRVVPLVIDQ